MSIQDSVAALIGHYPMENGARVHYPSCPVCQQFRFNGAAFENGWDSAVMEVLDLLHNQDGGHDGHHKSP